MTIEKLEDFPQNADTQKIINKVNELIELANKPAKEPANKPAPVPAKPSKAAPKARVAAKK